MDIDHVQPLVPIVRMAVAPHGLIGQTYDGDRRPMHGQRDSFEQLDDGTPTRSRTGRGGTITTRAKAEGAIEGTRRRCTEYVWQPFSIDFVFSRFRSLAATPRNITALRG
jgi:hypothetical protein